MRIQGRVPPVRKCSAREAISRLSRWFRATSHAPQVLPTGRGYAKIASRRRWLVHPRGAGSGSTSAASTRARKGPASVPGRRSIRRPPVPRRRRSGAVRGSRAPGTAPTRGRRLCCPPAAGRGRLADRRPHRGSSVTLSQRHAFQDGSRETVGAAPPMPPPQDVAFESASSCQRSGLPFPPGSRHRVERITERLFTRGPGPGCACARLDEGAPVTAHP